MPNEYENIEKVKKYNDNMAMKALIKKYDPYIHKTALSLNSSMMEDLISAGYEGLWHAIINYNPDKNIKFTTFAFHCIKGYMLGFFRDCCRMIKISNPAIRKLKEAMGSQEATSFVQFNSLDAIQEQNPNSPAIATSKDWTREFDKNSDVENALNKALAAIEEKEDLNCGIGKRDRQIFEEHEGLNGKTPISTKVLASKHNLKEASINRIIRKWKREIKENEGLRLFFMENYE